MGLYICSEHVPKPRQPATTEHSRSHIISRLAIKKCLPSPFKKGLLVTIVSSFRQCCPKTGLVGRESKNGITPEHSSDHSCAKPLKKHWAYHQYWEIESRRVILQNAAPDPWVQLQIKFVNLAKIGFTLRASKISQMGLLEKVFQKLKWNHVMPNTVWYSSEVVQYTVFNRQTNGLFSIMYYLICCDSTTILRRQ